MGLDMYAFSFDKSRLVDPNAQIALRFTDGEQEAASEFAYWRKFNRLHGWMERLYREKGGKDAFNCESVNLTEADIDKLEADWKAGKLTPTAGFFFGSGELYPEDDEALADFLAKARVQLAAGNGVLYDSWW